MLEKIYGENRLGLFTDLYQLTMAQDYFIKWGPKQPEQSAREQGCKGVSLSTSAKEIRCYID